MAYRLEATESVETGVRRVACEQLERTLAELDADDLGPHEKAFAVRKRCKKLRGLIRLVRPVFAGYRHENDAMRDAARSLAGLRDAAAMLATFDELVSTDINPGRFARIRAQLVAKRDETSQKDVHAALASFRDEMAKALARAQEWTIEAEGFDAIRGGLARTYTQAQHTMRLAYDERTPEAFHEWRKRIKYDRYHTRLLTEPWELASDDRYEQAKAVSDLLGQDHDLSELAAFLGSNEHELTREICRRQTDLRLRAHEIGTALYELAPDEHTRRIERLWTDWHAPIES